MVPQGERVAPSPLQHMTHPVFRFAPSPNGHLHLGHALSALLNADMARAAGGRLLLRIEDIDATRCRPEYEAAMLEDLAWLGIAWEEPVRRQSEHLDAYREALARLDAQGLVYPSFESRAEIARLVAEREAKAPWPRDPDGAPLYPGSAKRLSADERAARMAREPYALRLDMNAAVARSGALTWVETGENPKEEHDTLMAQPEAWGDVVLARKETPTSYHLSVVVDDALQGVTHVVRGQERRRTRHGLGRRADGKPCALDGGRGLKASPSQGPRQCRDDPSSFERWAAPGPSAHASADVGARHCSSTAAKRGSRAISAVMARSRSASVWIWVWLWLWVDMSDPRTRRDPLP